MIFVRLEGPGFTVIITLKNDRFNTKRLQMQKINFEIIISIYRRLASRKLIPCLFQLKHNLML